MSENKLVKPAVDQGSNEKLYVVRGQKIIFAHDLANIYEVEENIMNEAVANNLQRFPEEFMFQPGNDEWETLKSQFETLAKYSGAHPGYIPGAFTEKGVAMLSCVLNTPAAIRINIQLIQAYTSFDKKRGEELMAVFAILKKLLVKEEAPPREPIGFKIPKKN